MKNEKMIVLMVALAMAAMLGLAGCGGSQAPSSSAAPESSAAASASASAAEVSSSAAAESSAASSAAAPAPAPAPAAAADAASYIGEDAAKDIALKDAGFAAADVTELQAELDADDAVAHYDVEFKAGGMEYDYDIQAETGEILQSNSEVDD